MTARSRLLAAALTAAAALVPAATAHASASMQIGIADDTALLNEHSDARAQAVVAAWAALGIDDVRITVQWQAIAPDNAMPTAPAGFRGDDPASPGYDWTRVDRAVKLVSEAGMRPMLMITGPGPLWASQAPSLHRVRYKPRPDLFGDFAHAVATRYGGSVDRYIIWNEPNLPLWLQPQNTCSGRRCTPYAPHLYRRLVRAAYPAIKSSDPSAAVLFGALAPRGESQTKTNARTRPLAFIRGMACVDARLRRARSGPCGGFAPLTADGFAYHPHSTTLPPDEPQRRPDDAAMGDLARLERTLDGAQRAGGLRKAGGGRFGLYLTEWGYQTRPPDPIQGVSLAQQSRWLQQGAYIAWKDPRVKLLTQYEWRDEKLGRGKRATRYSGWQSGLRFADDRAKPSLAAFADPLFVDTTRSPARLWGQVRPGRAARVSVQRRNAGGGHWTTLRTLATNTAGYWRLAAVVHGTAAFRFTWRPTNARGEPAGARRSSDVVRVTRR